MSKNITFTYKDKEYILEFNRRTVQKLESQGFDFSNVGSNIMTYVPLIFKGAFEMHHSGLTQKKIDEMYDLFTDKQELFTALFELVAEPYNKLLEDNTSKNAIKWAKNF